MRMRVYARASLRTSREVCTCFWAKLRTMAPAAECTGDGEDSRHGHSLNMAKPFIFKCPRTGYNVQGYDDDDEPEMVEGKRYKMFECLACRGFHLIDPDTGELMGDRR